MKIGIDARLWNETGVGRYIRNLVKYLQIVDKENTYVLFIKSRDTQSVLNTVSQSNFIIKSADIRWHSLQEQVQMPQLLYKENLDLMHFPYFSLPIIYNRPYIVTIHDLIIYHYPTGKASTLPLPLYKVKHYGYKSIIKHAVRKAKKIIVPLQAVKNDLIHTLGVENDKIAITKEAVDSKLVQESVDKTQNLQFNHPYYLYVGNAYPHKNIETLLKAFIRLKQEINNKEIKLLLVGKEDYFYKKLQRNLEENNIHDIHIFHTISDSMLQDLYKHAVGVIAPSFMEGFGLVPLEALANNCLVIASDIPAHKEVCNDSALYFDPYKASELLILLKKVLDMKEEEKKVIIQSGIEICKEYSWKKMAEETKEIYVSLR